MIRYKGSPLTYFAFRILAAREGVRMLFRSSSFGRSVFTIVWLSFPAYTRPHGVLRLYRLPVVPGLFYRLHPEAASSQQRQRSPTAFLPARDLDHILFCGFDNIKCLGQCFRFVKDELQFQLPGDHFQLFRRAPITVTVCRRNLLDQAFHVCIQLGQLVLHGQDHCHECFPAETVQFFR